MIKGLNISKFNNNDNKNKIINLILYILNDFFKRYTANTDSINKIINLKNIF